MSALPLYATVAYADAPQASQVLAKQQMGDYAKTGAYARLHGNTRGIETARKVLRVIQQLTHKARGPVLKREVLEIAAKKFEGKLSLRTVQVVCKLLTEIGITQCGKGTIEYIPYSRRAEICASKSPVLPIKRVKPPVLAPATYITAAPARSCSVPEQIPEAEILAVEATFDCPKKDFSPNVSSITPLPPQRRSAAPFEKTTTSKDLPERPECVVVELGSQHVYLNRKSLKALEITAESVAQAAFQLSFKRKDRSGGEQALEARVVAYARTIQRARNNVHAPEKTACEDDYDVAKILAPELLRNGQARFRKWKWT